MVDHRTCWPKSDQFFDPFVHKLRAPECRWRRSFNYIPIVTARLEGEVFSAKLNQKQWMQENALVRKQSQRMMGCARSLDEQMHRVGKAIIFSSIAAAYMEQLSCLLGIFLSPMACSVLAEIAAPTVRNVMRLALLPADLRNSAFKSEIYVFRCQLRGIEYSLSLLRCTQW
jgi:hypothetical protein